MKTLTTSSNLLTVTLMVSLFTLKPVISKIEDICSMKDEELQASRAFIMMNDLYFGNDLFYWKVTVDDTFTADKNETIATIFGNINLKRIVTAVHFGRLTCANCQQIKNAVDLLLVVGSVDDQRQTFGYKAYRALANQYPGVIDSKSKMPWNLEIEGTMTGIFWPETQENYTGVTFDETTKTMYAMSSWADANIVKWGIHYHSVDGNGNFPKAFNKTEPKKIYTALIDWKGKIFGLLDNKFYLLKITGSDVKEEEEYSLKTSLNCDGKSPLLATTSITTISTEDNNSSESTDTAVPMETTTSPLVDTSKSEDSEEGTTLPQTEPSGAAGAEVVSPTKGKDGSPIIWIIIIIVVIVIIMAIIICIFFYKAKTGTEQMDGKAPTKSGTDLNVMSETGSKPGSKVAVRAMASKSASTSRSGGSKAPKSRTDSGRAKPGSSIGSNIGRSGMGSTTGSAGSLQQSSSLESKASVRSIH